MPALPTLRRLHDVNPVSLQTTKVISYALNRGAEPAQEFSTYEVPGHYACMLYAAIACPFLAFPNAGRTVDGVGGLGNEAEVAVGTRRGALSGLAEFTSCAVELPHSVTVRPYQGTGPYGDVFGTPVVHRAFVEDRRRLVVSASGEDVISETTVYASPDALVQVGSRVTIWAGTAHERTARVITTSRFDHPLAWSHLEITLT